MHVSATVPSDVTLLSNSNNDELFIINLATAPADVILLSRLRKAVSLAEIMKKLITIIILMSTFTLRSFSQRVELSVPDSNDVNYSLYTYTKNLIKVLHVDNLQKGFDSVDIRIWRVIGFSFLNEMYEIKKRNGKWIAFYNPFILNNSENGKVELKYKEAHEIPFKSNPDSFFRELKYLGIDTLKAPDPWGLEDVTVDGYFHCFEFATRKRYNFYESNYVDNKKEKFKQAAICARIISLFESEFALDKRRKETLSQWKIQNRWK